MPTQIPKECMSALAELKSSYRFRRIAGENKVRCEIIDMAREDHPVYASAVHEERMEALKLAIADARKAPKPQTAAEIAKENAELRERLAKLEAAGKQSKGKSKQDAPEPATTSNN